MSEQKNAQAIIVPASGGVPELKLDLQHIMEAELRYPEVKMVNPITYVELEHSFNESYRDIKRNLAKIGDQLNIADKRLEEIKADILLDRYPAFMDGKPKSQDNADMRRAFMAKDPEYSAILDRVNQLKALEAVFEGKLKVVENVCRYMRQQMQIVVRSGLTDRDLYNK